MEGVVVVVKKVRWGTPPPRQLLLPRKPLTASIPVVNIPSISLRPRSRWIAADSCSDIHGVGPAAWGGWGGFVSQRIVAPLPAPTVLRATRTRHRSRAGAEREGAYQSCQGDPGARSGREGFPREKQLSRRRKWAGSSGVGIWEAA